MRGAALVFVGGALGSLARYGLGLVVEPFWSVWVVNVLGSLALGLLLGWLRAESLPSSCPQPAKFAPTAREVRAHSLRLLAGTGFLGGFTTYSAFALDIVSWGMVAGPVFGLAAGAAQVAFGLVAALLGFAIAESASVRRAA